MKNETDDEEMKRIQNGLAYFVYMKVYEGTLVTFDNIGYRLQPDDNQKALLVTNLHTGQETVIPIASGYSLK